MLDIPGAPVIDKARLLGGCVRLPLQVDAQRLEAEVASLPAGHWGGQGGRVGVHRAAEAIFLRGHAPAQGDLPVDDRPALELLPYVRELITQRIPSQPLRCLLARLPAGGQIAEHIDRGLYFAKSLRVHVPVTSHAQAWMYASGRTYLMRPGEVWVLNNSGMHGVWNAHESLSRTHLICDFLPTPALLELVARGERELGVVDAAVAARVGEGGFADPRPQVTSGGH
jgi:hypothetical protein